MTFHQNYENVGAVYNVAGDLTLTQQSSREDYAAAIRKLRERIDGLEGVPDDERREIGEELDEAAEDDEAPEAAGRLARVAGRLRALSGTADAAVQLAQSAETMARWAGQHL